MHNPNFSVGRAPSLLCRQYAELLDYLEKAQSLWIDSRYGELTDIPRDLEIFSQKISATLRELQRKLRMNGFATLRQWEESMKERPPGARVSDRLKQLAGEIRQRTRTQNLLVQNLLIFVRGVTSLNQTRLNVVYSQPNSNSNGRTAVSKNLHYRG